MPMQQKSLLVEDTAEAIKLRSRWIPRKLLPPTLACGKELLLMVDMKVNLRTLWCKMSVVAEIFDAFKRVISLHSRNQSLHVLKDVPNLHQAWEV